MITLAIDTAGRSASVAVLQEDALLYEATCNAAITHSETLLPMVDAALKACALTMADVGLLGVTAGPGSFTGLRIGLATAKGLALPQGIPCAGVSTLEAMAAAQLGEGTVMPVLDARRGQVYRAAFDLSTHARLLEDDAVPAQDMQGFVASCKKPLFFVGDGAALCYNIFGQAPGVIPCPAALRPLRAAGVGLAALACYTRGEATKADALLPAYHRLSQAERERVEREAAGKA